jgi:hypothetical protein
MRYNRASIDSAMQTARKAAAKNNATVYVFATYCGWTLDYRIPAFGQAHYAVAPDGTVSEGGAGDEGRRTDMATTYEFWRHKTSGDLAAVMLDDRGRVVGACSPIGRRDVRAQPDPSGYNFDIVGDDADDFNRNADAYTPVEPAEA